jgi:hypothetical protein
LKYVVLDSQREHSDAGVGREKDQAS